MFLIVTFKKKTTLLDFYDPKHYKEEDEDEEVKCKIDD